jgi:hypothetical protein
MLRYYFVYCVIISEIITFFNFDIFKKNYINNIDIWEENQVKEK